jgi:hypothetical protein
MLQIERRTNHKPYANVAGTVTLHAADSDLHM